MPHLLRLTYISRAVGVVDKPFVAALLLQSRQRNAVLDIRGVLCTGRGTFVQSLEGPEANVITLYARILRDPRHRDVSLVSIGLAGSRSFAQWSMAHIEGDALSDGAHAALVQQAREEAGLSEQARLLQATFTALRKAV